MKNRKIALAFILPLVVVACTKEKLPAPAPTTAWTANITLTPAESERMILLNTTYSVSRADILQYAQGVIRSITRDEIKTKGRSKDRIPVVVDSTVTEYTLNSTTKGVAPEVGQSKVYVVSLGRDAGFAVMAGDKRGGGVLAFSGEGTYDPSSVHPGMRYTLQCMSSHVVDQIERLESLRGDSIYNAMLERYGTVGPREQTKVRMPVWNGEEFVEMEVDNVTSVIDHYELITESADILLAAKWGQGYPYNQYIYNYYGKSYPAGCVATAVAQIMSYHKFGSYNNAIFLWDQFPASNDWSSVPEEVTNSVCNLFWYLGRPANLNMQYSLSGSSAQSSSAVRTFNNFGYTSEGIRGYSHATAVREIDAKRPVYVRGEQQGASTGHAWVVDGVQHDTHWDVWKIEYWYQGQLLATVYEKRYPTGYTPYVHINWGWDGYLNCWNLANVFDTHGAGNYSFSNNMITGIKPR